MVQMVRQNIAYAAKFVKLTNRKNNRAGNIGRALKGIAPAFRPSFGYVYRAEYREANGRRQVINAWWEIDEPGPDGKPEHGSPAWVVQQTFAWVGQREKTLHWVAKELNNLGIPTAQGRRWNPGKVHRLVRNRCYSGKHAYNVNARVPSLNQPLTDITAEIKRNRKEPKPESEWVYFDVPPLVPEVLWKRANELLTARGRGRGKQGKRIEALLRGRIFCPNCRQPMVVRRHTKNRQRAYYHCRRHGERWREQPCTYSKFIPSSWDEVIWADLCSLLRDDRWLDAELESLQSEAQAVSKLNRQQEIKASQAQNKISKIQQGFEGGIYSIEQAKSRIAHLNAQAAEAEQESKRLMSRSGNGPASSLELSALKTELRVLRDRNLDQTTFQEKTDIIGTLGLRVFPADDLKTMRVQCQLRIDKRPNAPNPIEPDPEYPSNIAVKTEPEQGPGWGKVSPAPPNWTKSRTFIRRTQ